MTQFALNGLLVPMLHKRFDAWKNLGYPSCDEEIRPMIELLGQARNFCPVFSCSGHDPLVTVSHPDKVQEREKIFDFYVMFGATEQGFQELYELVSDVGEQLLDHHRTEAPTGRQRDFGHIAMSDLRLSITPRACPFRNDSSYYRAVLLTAARTNHATRRANFISMVMRALDKLNYEKR